MRPKDPKRLRVSAGSALERRVLASAAEDEPSPELRHRMASVLGVSAAPVGGAGMAAATARVAAGKATAAGSASSVLPWISVGGIVVVIIAGAVVGTQAWRKSARPSPAPAAIRLGPESGAGTERPGPDSTADATEAATSRNQTLARQVPSGRRARALASPPDLRDQMALIDGARNGLASGAADKALTLVRQYQQRYPGGIFDPEAAALRIEALVRLGRSSEARGLAERFVATQPAGPLTERVKAVAGLARP